MHLRQRLGARRTARHVIQDVNVGAIPALTGRFRVVGADEVALVGDAPKNLIDFEGERNHQYIAKAPRREGYPECVTEYLIAQVASLLPLRVARARLATIGRCPDGTPDVRFLSRIFCFPPERLVHGIELVARAMSLPTEVVAREVHQAADRERGFYGANFVCEILRDRCAHDGAADQLRIAFARMLAFDALVGANDRHAMNWGVIENVEDPDQPPRFAPLYDTARGLFWNLKDKQLATRTPRARQDLLVRYANKSTALIGAPGSPKGSHFDLIRYVMRERSLGLHREVARVVRAFRPHEARRILHYRFGRLFSRLRLELIYDVLEYRHKVLCDVVEAS